MIDATQNTEGELLQLVKDARSTGLPVKAVLKTDQRVFARITDGIYREPASALRELIANSYDADATEVRIETDAPRFSKFTIRDDGHGLTEDALVHVICHIGGSLKRTQEGSAFNVVSTNDSNLSPGKRKLIGKLGIGLFSVSQLTHHLIIVTKVAGENVRRVCDILLMPQSDDANSNAEQKSFVTGNAEITTIPASDLDAHGTEIHLLDIRPFVRESLQSSGLWTLVNPEFRDDGEEKQAVDDHEDDEDDGFVERPEIPRFHIGQVSRIDPETLVLPACLPWLPSDSEQEKFLKLVTGVQSLSLERKNATEKIKISEVLDMYLRTIWTLSLSVPLPYARQHPFSLDCSSGFSVFALSNKPIRPSAELIELQGSQTIREYGRFSTPDTSSPTPFAVIFDGISLKRPLLYPVLTPSESQAASPLLFVGKIRSEMASLPDEYSGGPIDFEGYFCWQPKIVPAEHNGLMIRINGASGILFDDRFLNYQISEQTRLRQVTGEIYINQGLDAALNIDRESFNIAHPHYQFLKKWVHHCLRQLMSRHKALNKNSLDTKLSDGLQQAKSQLLEIISFDNTQSAFTQTPSSSGAANSAALNDKFIYDRASVLSPRAGTKKTTRTEKLREKLIEEQISAVSEILQSYGVFSKVRPEVKNEILRKIVAVFTVDIK